MKRFVNYIRQTFCKHNFEIEDQFVINNNGEQGEKRYLFCRKCGYHNNHWKHINIK